MSAVFFRKIGKIAVQFLVIGQIREYIQQFVSLLRQSGKVCEIFDYLKPFLSADAHRRRKHSPDRIEIGAVGMLAQIDRKIKKFP